MAREIRTAREWVVSFAFFNASHLALRGKFMQRANRCFMLKYLTAMRLLDECFFTWFCDVKRMREAAEHVNEFHPLSSSPRPSINHCNLLLPFSSCLFAQKADIEMILHFYSRVLLDDALSPPLPLTSNGFASLPSLSFFLARPLSVE